MLRFLIVVSLSLVIVFTGIGVLVSRQWGWSEYASPELYVVYYEGSQLQYFLVNADGNSQGEKLTWKDGAITELDCSPDGRTLAFLTDAAHLYVIANTGILYDRIVDRHYLGNVANNGTITWSGLLVDAHHVSPLAPPDHGIYNQNYGGYDHAAISPSGITIWSKTDNQGIEIRSATGEMIAYFHYGYLPRWLASEQVFTFNDFDPNSHGFFLVDATTHDSARINTGAGDQFGVFSPDATKFAFSNFDLSTVTTQIFLAAPFSNHHMQQLTENSDISYRVGCFLTFRPQMLIADKQ